MASTEFPAIDRDKSPLLAADEDAELIADALRNSPHIIAVDTEPGDTIRFTVTEGMSYRIRMSSAPPLTDAPMTEPIPTEAAAAAILNHPAFVVALPDDDIPVHPRLPAPLPDPLPVQGITVQTREGFSYYLAVELDLTRRCGQELSAPAADVAYAADRVLAGDPSDSDRAVAGLLNYVAATWDRQDVPLREHAQAVARSLIR
ncbi:hypothetical protein [Streptomyces cavernae]|uniref:hypothetical protein n=1 Tax=Streptomyces cavernae TaxID=2259034 RepID=UPI000FEB7F48|nr:hypothetical protein [Streptomyces cavernae]